MFWSDFHILLALLTCVSVVWCGPEEDEAKDLLSSYFNVNRHPQRKNSNREARSRVQEAITRMFEEQKLTVDFEQFETDIIIDGRNKITVSGKNIIGLMKGNNWMTGLDNILVIGAHYDTDALTKGVDDNGSGVVAMIQIIRRLRSFVQSCKFNNTVIFVAFDISSKEYMWKTGSDVGSHSFINQYLIPKVLKPSLPSARPNNFLGTIILDSILNFNDSHNSQTLPKGFDGEFQYQYNDIARHGFAGDFLLLIRRAGPQSYLEKNIEHAWSDVEYESENIYEDHRLLTLPIDPTDKTSETVKLFVQQDHMSFWTYNRGLDTILLTDTGDKRGYMRNCHHTPCDDMQNVRPEHLRFLTHTVKVIVSVVKKLAIKHCTETSSTTRTVSSLLLSFMSPLLIKILY